MLATSYSSPLTAFPTTSIPWWGNSACPKKPSAACPETEMWKHLLGHYRRWQHIKGTSSPSSGWRIFSITAQEVNRHHLILRVRVGFKQQLNCATGWSTFANGSQQPRERFWRIRNCIRNTQSTPCRTLTHPGRITVSSSSNWNPIQRVPSSNPRGTYSQTISGFLTLKTLP